MKIHRLVLLLFVSWVAAMSWADSKSPCMRRITISQDSTEVGYIDVEDLNCYYVLTAVAKPGYRFSHWSDGLTLTSHEAYHQDADYTAYFVATTPSALPETQTEAQPEKFIQDGHLFIRVQERVYDGLGNTQKGGKQ